MSNAVGCKLVKSGPLAVANATLVKPSFTTAGEEHYDQGPCHSLSTNPTRITVPGFTATSWIVGASARFDEAVADNQVLEVTVLQGGGALAVQRLVLNAGDPNELSVATMAVAGAGEYFEMGVYHTLGATVDVTDLTLWAICVLGG